MKLPRKKLPKELAVIDPDICTGCEACIEICSVECIATWQQYPEAPGLRAWCEVDWDHCIGCKMCIRLPGKNSEPHELTVCPWGAISMVPVAELIAVVDGMGSPPPLAEANRQRLLAVAERQVRALSE